MQPLLAVILAAGTAGLVILPLGGLALSWNDRVRERHHRPPIATTVLDREFGAAVAEDHATGARRITLVRRGGQDERDGPWRARMAMVELALDAALICAGYDAGTVTAPMLRHTSGAGLGRRHQCWRIPGPYADGVVARVEHQLAECSLGSQYCLRTDADLSPQRSATVSVQQGSEIKPVVWR